MIENVSDLPELMVWADLAVTAGGSTCWELAYMGVPSLIIVIADNQRRNAEELDKRGIAQYLGRSGQITVESVAQGVMNLLSSFDARAEMSKRGRKVVDGSGAERIVKRLYEPRLRLRRAEKKDAQLLWQWANDPETRGASFNPGPISWEGHLKWLASKLGYPDCSLYIAMDENATPVGQVRFEATGREAVVSVSIDSGFRGKGYGSAALVLASSRYFRESPSRALHAYIKKDNETSRAAFMKAGFHEAQAVVIHDHPAFHMVRFKESPQ
jgi:UDP-2,4-diacetamido-2,4,6-trideoxy-beta-L-altropyranose hydrolase